MNALFKFRGCYAGKRKWLEFTLSEPRFVTKKLLHNFKIIHSRLCCGLIPESSTSAASNKGLKIINKRAATNCAFCLRGWATGVTLEWLIKFSSTMVVLYFN